MKVGQVGRSFESASEYRDYQRQNPDCAVVDADSTEWRKHVDTAREKAERTAKRRGYRDLADQREKRGLEQRKERGEVDAKVFV